MGKIVGVLCEEEATEIRRLYEKKTALENLIKIIDPSNHELYTKITTDYTQALSMFQKWWDTMSQKYNWERSENGNWMVNFDTYEVSLAG